MGDVLSGVLSGGSDAERVVVPGWKLASCRIVHLHVPHGRTYRDHMSAASRTAARTSGADMPFFNFATITAFLAWFGGTGYLLTRYSTLGGHAGAAGLRSSLGLVGAALSFWFVAKLLLAHDPRTRSRGLRARGSAGPDQQPDSRGRHRRNHLLAGGHAADLRRAQRKRRSLPRGTEVIITRYEQGIAYVRRWEEMAGKEAATVA